VTLTFELVTLFYRGHVLTMTNRPAKYCDCHFLRYWADMVFALNGTVTLTFNLVTSTFTGVISWVWPIFPLSTMTVTYKLFKILSGHGFCIKWYCYLALWPSDLKICRVIYWPWPIFLPSIMTVTYNLFKILTWHDVANGRTDRQTDGQTDGRTPYHNTSKVLLRAYKNLVYILTKNTNAYPA